MWTEATWINGTRRLTGRWTYYRPSDHFIIHLDSKDRITGQPRRVVTRNRATSATDDKPEWGNWKLEEGK